MTAVDSVAQRIADAFAQVTSANDDDDSVGEFRAAEYIVFVLALDTYIRHLEETIEFQIRQKKEAYARSMEGPTDQDPWEIEQEIAELEKHAENPTDAVVEAGVKLLRRLDREQESFAKYLEDQLPSDSHKKLLVRTLRRPARDAEGAGTRALGLRTVLNRGGPKTIRAIFDTAQARKQIKVAIAAATLEDGNAALDMFAAMPASVLRNPLVRKWIKWAAKTAQPLVEMPTELGLSSGDTGDENPIDEATSGASGEASKLLSQQSQQEGSSSPEDVLRAQDERQEALDEIQRSATEEARDALEKSGEPDEPPVKSEVVGIATAAAVAAMSDPSNPQNVPETIKHLDEEQRAAALTDGRVLVAAGAGSGKSTTLVARINHLVRDRGVYPSRILATSFNTKAAAELKTKIGKAAGSEAVQQMSVGTMHSLFRRFIGDYGSKEERTAMGLNKGGPGGFVGTGNTVAYAAQRIWKECYPSQPEPRLKNAMMFKSLWSGNNVSPAQALADAEDEETIEIARWYELYQGLKGAIPGWEPPCYSKGYEAFMSRKRPRGIRLGDFDDMLGIFRDVLKREPAVQEAVQKMFDHVLVDECQDLNQTQSDIIDMMTGHIQDDGSGKSVWMVGDPNQSIYSFRGARPDLFEGRHDQEGWTTRMIRTNYRCQPEIVEHANDLIQHNDQKIPMEAVPNPARPRNTASIRVETPSTEAQAALSVIEEIKTNSQGLPDEEQVEFYSQNACLFRTNKEIHAYETACIIRGIPYARKGASSFLGSPETKTFLSYLQLVTGSDHEKMQKAFGEIINRPNRFFVSPDRGKQAVEDVINEYARRVGENVKNLNPNDLLKDSGSFSRTSTFVEMLAEKLSGSFSGFKYRKTLESLRELSDEIDRMRANVSDPEYTTKDLFEDILGLKGKGTATDPNTGKTLYVDQTLRESLNIAMRDSLGDDEDNTDEDDEGEMAGLGNIAFLYRLAEVDPTDPYDLETDPNTPLGFQNKMERYSSKVRDLRIDLNSWEKKQQALPPAERVPPPGVYLGTAHSVKGAEWPSVYVSMPAGKFPFEPPQKPGAPPPSPEEVDKRLADERRLAYVSLTRAAKNLTVICPSEVGGKPGGVSQFVGEAGLKIGENVPKPGTDEEEETSKTAQESDTTTTLSSDGFDPYEASLAWREN